MPHAHPTAKPSTTKPARRGKRQFLAEYIRKPTQIGAIAPSSPQLARKMIKSAGVDTAKAVVEFGPGTGAFTGEILRHLAPGATFFAIELSPLLAEHSRERHPKAKVHVGSAADVANFCHEEGLARTNSVDCIVSGLPWASFPEPLQRSILKASLAVLKPGGVLVTFGYHIGAMLPAGKRFARLLPDYFTSITRSGPIWLNLPPAFVIRCVKPN